jgi:glycosyltransferase involved in cell wall biosynthesis
MNNYEIKHEEKMLYLIDNYTNEEERQELKSLFSNMANNIDLQSENRPIVAFSVPAETGTSHWRILEPLFSLWKEYREEFLFLYFEGELNDYNLLSYVDIWVQHRAGAWHANSLNIRQQYPKSEPVSVVIHDVDDNEFNIPVEHPLHKIWTQHKKDGMSKKQLRLSDYITTTTKALKRAFDEFNQSKKIKIIPNSINFDMKNWNTEYTRPDKYKDKTVIGWCGLSHPEDLVYLAKIYTELNKKYGDSLHFIVAGVNKWKESDNCKFEESYEGLVQTSFKTLVDKGVIDIFENKPLADYMQFYQMFDVNTAYVVNRKWNTYKSNIKAMEAAAMGKVTVMSNVGPYNDFSNELPIYITDKVNLVCSKNVISEWVKNMSYWIDNPDKRETVGKQIKEYVREKYHIKNANHLRYNLYKEILTK